MKKVTGIQGIVLLPLVVILVITMMACAALYYTQESIVSSYLLDEINTKISATDSDMQERRDRTVKSVKQLSKDYGELYKAIKKHDYSALEEEMEWMKNAADLSAYIYTDMDGNILTSSLENVNTEKLNEVIEAVKENSLITGCAMFVDGMICEYASSIVNNDEGERIGIATLIGFVATDQETIDALKTKFGVEVYVFSGITCYATTCKLIQLSQARLIDDAQQTADAGEMWVGPVAHDGVVDYFACVPMKDCKGQTTGILTYQLLETLTGNILGTLRSLAILLVALVALVCFGIGMRLRRKLIKPMKRLSEDVALIATGDLTCHTSEVHTCQEIDAIREDVDNMRGKMADVLKPAIDTVNTVMGTIGQLTEASMNMSDAANRQAASLEEISSSMEEMGANIQANTSNAVDTNKLAEEISTRVEHLGSSSASSFEAIQNIANDISSINDLVMQTNILSLNASVEAARAGEQGKGFAVVAKEVGRLADQTHSTADLINETANSSIVEVQNSNKEVSELLPQIATVVEHIKEITTASVEQNTGVTQVNSAIMELNRVTQQNAATAEEIAANAQELQRLLLELKEEMSAFKV